MFFPPSGFKYEDADTSNVEVKTMDTTLSVKDLNIWVALSHGISKRMMT